MTTIRTASGSLYEIDEASNQVRRLAGAADPTPYTGEDGRWKEYHTLGRIAVGVPLVILWPDMSPVVGLGGTLRMRVPATITSPVEEIRPG